MRQPAGALYERLFIPFDISVFTAIRPPRAIDPLRPMLEVEQDAPVMPWCPPVDGVRAAAWRAPAAFVTETNDAFAYQLLLEGPAPANRAWPSSSRVSGSGFCWTASTTGFCLLLAEGTHDRLPGKARCELGFEFSCSVARHPRTTLGT